MHLKLAIVLAAALAVTTADAQQNAQPSETSSPFKPVDTPKLDPEVFKTPQAGEQARELSKAPAKANSVDVGQRKPEAPAGVEIGKYDKYKLDFNAARTTDVNPRTGFDSGEAANLSKSLQQGKTEPVLPDYFGLKLTTPTN